MIILLRHVMDLESLRKYCRSLPHVTEDVKWGNDLCFLIAKKMFCVACLDQSAPVRMSFKCTPEKFSELIEENGITPAAYMARNHWISLERWDALRDSEIKSLVRESYGLVLAKLPKKMQAKLSH